MKLFLLHLGIVLYFCIVWRGIVNIALIPTSNPKLQKIQMMKTRFLTNWNFALQSSLFFGYLFHDVMRIFGHPIFERSPLKKILDSVFYSISAPLSIFVCLIFWGLFITNREFVFPKEIDEIMPLWANHVLHTFIVVTVLLQTVFNRQASDLRQSFKAITFVMFCYFICLYYTRYELGIWVYPFLHLLVEPWRVLVFLILFAIFLLFTTVYHYANNFYCGSGRSVDQRTSTEQEVLQSKKRSD